MHDEHCGQRHVDQLEPQKSDEKPLKAHQPYRPRPRERPQNDRRFGIRRAHARREHHIDDERSAPQKIEAADQDHKSLAECSDCERRAAALWKLIEIGKRRSVDRVNGQQKRGENDDRGDQPAAAGDLSSVSAQGGGLGARMLTPQLLAQDRRPAPARRAFGESSAAISATSRPL
jgi:hypothetical protein